MDHSTSEVISGLWVSEHNGGLTFFQPDTGQIFVCNHVGAQIWSGLSKGLRIEEISGEIVASFDVSPVTAKQETCAFVAQIESRGWLGRRPAES
jgi:hypothetical protein